MMPVDGNFLGVARIASCALVCTYGHVHQVDRKSVV